MEPTDLLLVEVKIPPIAVKLKVWEPSRIAYDIGCDIRKEYPRMNIISVLVPYGQNANVVMSDIVGHPDVEWAEFEERGSLSGTYFDPPITDLDLGSWQNLRMGVYHAWKYTKGDPSVLVAPIDTGVLWHVTEHPFGPPYTYNLPVPKTEFQYNTYYDIADATLPDHPPEMNQQSNTMLHGTQVYRAMCGAKNGTDLYCPNCELGYISAAPSGADGCTPLDMIEGIYKITDWGIQYGKKVVISISWTWFSLQTEWQAAVNYAWANNGIVLAAAGNSGINLMGTTGYPAACGNVVDVGGFEAHDIPYGNYGSRVNIIGPYWSVDSLGTSLATPRMAAAAALIWSANLDLTNTQVVSLLISESEKTRQAPRGTYPHFYPGAGVARIGRSVAKAVSMKASNAGLIFPYVEFRSSDAEMERLTALSKAYNGSRPAALVGNGQTWDSVKTRLYGNLEVDVLAFSSDPITNVELKIGNSVVYSGLPRTVVFDSSKFAGGVVSVTATTANSTITEVYDDIVLQDGGLTIGGTTFRPHVVANAYDAPRYGLKIYSKVYDNDAVSLPLGEVNDSRPIRVSTPSGIKAIVKSLNMSFQDYVRAHNPAVWLRLGELEGEFLNSGFGINEAGSAFYLSINLTLSEGNGFVTRGVAGPAAVTDGNLAARFPGNTSYNQTGIYLNSQINMSKGKPGTFLAWVKGPFDSSLNPLFRSYNSSKGRGVMAGILGALDTGWGDNSYHKTMFQPGLASTKLVSGRNHSLALSSNGGIGKRVVGWGSNTYGQITYQAASLNALDVAAGEDFSLAVKSDGTVIGWGYNVNGERTIPANLTGVTAVAAGDHHSLALKNDKTVVAWGLNDMGQATVPLDLTNVKAIDGGYGFSIALKEDGTLVGWGDNTDGQITIPVNATDVNKISAGGKHVMALKNDGTVVVWGNNSSGQTDVPVGLNNVTAISAGYDFCLALKNDGTVVAWGNDASGQVTIPDGLVGVRQISAGYDFALASYTTPVWSLQYYNGGPNTEVYNTLWPVPSITDNEWHLLMVIAHADGNVSAFMDNVQLAPSQYEPTLTNISMTDYRSTSTICMTGHPFPEASTATYSFKGSMDEFAYFDHEFTPAERDTLWTGVL